MDKLVQEKASKEDVDKLLQDKISKEDVVELLQGKANTSDLSKLEEDIKLEIEKMKQNSSMEDETKDKKRYFSL